MSDLAVLGRQRSGGVALTDAQASVLGALHGHAFQGPNCCPSQALLASEVGLSREYVNRLCRELHRLGLICWAKARRIGAQWDHNVYRLRHWQPVLRRRMLKVLTRIRGRFSRSVHTKRTALADDVSQRGVTATVEVAVPLHARRNSLSNRLRLRETAKEPNMPLTGAQIRTALADTGPTVKGAVGSNTGGQVVTVNLVFQGVACNPEDVYDMVSDKFGGDTKVISDKDFLGQGGYTFRIIP